MSHLGMLGGADHAVVLRPLRREGTALTVTITVVRLDAPPALPADGQPKATPATVENGVSIRVWSDLWTLSGPTAADLHGKDRRTLRIRLASTEYVEHGRLIAEVLWRQADATADDYAVAAAYYLAKDCQNSQDEARGREILWAGYSRFRSGLLAKLLLCVEQLSTRRALLAAHPTVLEDSERHLFDGKDEDKSKTSVRHDRLKVWSKKMINEVYDVR
jgi:hypothetical protein